MIADGIMSIEQKMEMDAASIVNYIIIRKKAYFCSIHIILQPEPDGKSMKKSSVRSASSWRNIRLLMSFQGKVPIRIDGDMLLTCRNLKKERETRTLWQWIESLSFLYASPFEQTVVYYYRAGYRDIQGIVSR